jgi:predicted nucleic acid-binding protein
LSPQARAIFREADLGRVQIIIPAMVLVEVMYLAERNRITTQLAEVIALVKASTNYIIVPLDEIVISVAQTLPTVIELHDRLIAATAKALDIALITKDELLRKISQLKTVW